MPYGDIVNKQIPGSPVDVKNTAGSFLRHTYRGDNSTLATHRPAIGADWNGNEVAETELVQIGRSLTWQLTVLAQTPDATPAVLGSSQISNNEFPLLETDYEAVERPLRQHPAFAGFDETDWQAIDLWIDETDSENRKIFKYWKRDKDGNTTGTIQTLSAAPDPDKSQQDFAAAYLLGVESFVDYAPIARKTSLYKGTSKPTSSDIGQKIVGDPFTGVPSGYQWVKRADRAVKQGRGYHWTRVEEWIGAREVLVDKDDIFI